MSFSQTNSVVTISNFGSVKLVDLVETWRYRIISTDTGFYQVISGLTNQTEYQSAQASAAINYALINMISGTLLIEIIDIIDVTQAIHCFNKDSILIQGSGWGSS